MDSYRNNEMRVEGLLNSLYSPAVSYVLNLRNNRRGHTIADLKMLRQQTIAFKLRQSQAVRHKIPGLMSTIHLKGNLGKTMQSGVQSKRGTVSVVPKIKKTSIFEYQENQ